jgi:hypothetical protein
VRTYNAERGGRRLGTHLGRSCRGARPGANRSSICRGAGTRRQHGCGCGGTSSAQGRRSPLDPARRSGPNNRNSGKAGQTSNFSMHHTYNNAESSRSSIVPPGSVPAAMLSAAPRASASDATQRVEPAWPPRSWVAAVRHRPAHHPLTEQPSATARENLSDTPSLLSRSHRIPYYGSLFCTSGVEGSVHSAVCGPAATRKEPRSHRLPRLME